MGRRRTERTHNVEDETLSQIAKEAEARLAQKRAARIEAREIRMRELERQQREAKEKGDHEGDSRSSKVAVLSRTSSVASPTAVYNHSASPSLSGSDYSISLDSSQDVKSALSQIEEKYRLAMVQSAQLENERSQLYYQTQLLKDLLEDQEDQFYRLSAEHKTTCQELERQRRAFTALEKKCYDLQESLHQRDELIQEQGLVVVGESHREVTDGLDEDENDFSQSKIALVTPEAAQVLQSTGEGSLDAQLKLLAEEKRDLIDQVRRLKIDLDEERKKVLVNGGNEAQQTDNRIPELQLLEIQREANKQVNEFKLKLQKSEQDYAACQNHVTRLDGQVQRLKQVSENYEKQEDEMRAEKRKIMRDYRSALDRVDELEMTNSHLEKRLERMRASRTALTQS